MSDPLVKGSWTSRGALGAASELVACAHLMSQGFHVYRCESPHAPFDLVAYRDGSLTRVEVKSANGPSFSWPTNDEWDLLVVVALDGTCVEVTDHDRSTAQAHVRQGLGYEPKTPAFPGTTLASRIVDLLREAPWVEWRAAEVALALSVKTPVAAVGLCKSFDRGEIERVRVGVYRSGS